MGWKNILGEFKGESPLKQKRGRCQRLKAFAMQEKSYLQKGKYSNHKIKTAVRLKGTTPPTLRPKLFLVWHFLWSGLKYGMIPLEALCHKCITFSYLFTYYLIWRRCTRYVAFHFASLPSHGILDRLTGDDGRTCRHRAHECI